MHCAESIDGNDIVTTFSIPFEIPAINSDEDAYEYMKHWQGSDYGVTHRTVPVIVCAYCVKHADGSLERVANQIFSVGEIGADKSMLTPAQSEPAVSEFDGRCVFRTFATAANAGMLAGGLDEYRKIMEIGEGDELVAIPFDDYYGTKPSLSETKTHDIPYSMFTKDTER